MKYEKKVSIIGTHGLYASHGGFETLVKNLVEYKENNYQYIIFNSKFTKKPKDLPENIKVIRIPLSASGKIGVLYDYISIVLAFFLSNTFLLLGSQGILIIPLCKVFKKINVIVNLDGVENERSSFSTFAKVYLKLCYKMSYIFADKIILDNGYFKKITPKKILKKAYVIPYGAKIDKSLTIQDHLKHKYTFLESRYFMALGRAIEDNNLYELCSFFSKKNQNLVLISVLDKNVYGRKILKDFGGCSNIFFINGLYNKSELDLIRSNCVGYIHTHSLCGTAPSLVEAICSNIPIISIDAPQNRYTLDNQCAYFKEFSDLNKFINFSYDELNSFKPNFSIASKYTWEAIVNNYEKIL